MAWLAGAAGAAGSAIGSAAASAGSAIGSAASSLGGAAQGAASKMLGGGGTGGGMPMMGGGGGIASSAGSGLADLPDMGGMGGQLFGSSGTSQPGFQPPSRVNVMGSTMPSMTQPTPGQELGGAFRDFGRASQAMFKDPSGANIMETLGQGMRLRQMIGGGSGGNGNQNQQNQPFMSFINTAGSPAINLANAAQYGSNPTPGGVALTSRGLQPRAISSQGLMNTLMQQIASRRQPIGRRVA